MRIPFSSLSPLSLSPSSRSFPFFFFYYKTIIICSMYRDSIQIYLLFYYDFKLIIILLFFFFSFARLNNFVFLPSRIFRIIVRLTAGFIQRRAVKIVDSRYLFRDEPFRIIKAVGDDEPCVSRFVFFLFFFFFFFLFHATPPH